ncbi:NADH-quinone oxidoreductase subunit L [Hydrogenibacillus sp. N12]|nr:NADH-quinone oxidoreductase subunit L [Hydrogenibacillus sp. N12]
MGMQESWLPWAVLAPPFGAFVLLAAFRRPLGRLAGWIGTAGATLALAFALQAAWTASGGVTLSAPNVALLSAGDVRIELGAAIGPLQAVMLVVVAAVSAFVHLYSIGYMAGHRRYGTYFQHLSLFTLAMLGLVVATNWVVFYLFWELVGAASYLLIGFDVEREAARRAAVKAFVVTRIGDLGLLAAIWGMAQGAGSFDIAETLAWASSGAAPAGTVTALGLLMLLGAAGKSGQFPLHVWLPDAMEGPTPVSALLHAATMVAAGAYLLALAFPIVQASPEVARTTAVLGAFTALFAATLALGEGDLKRVLAYSTVSQLGYMFLAVGAGSRFAAMFHLTTHAFFKALLFLAAGAVYHAVGTNDLAAMGGLARRMPKTAALFALGGLALVGLPPLAGFFSKDAVLAAAQMAGGVPLGLGVVTVFLTAVYMGRLYVLAFFGEPRTEAAREAREPGGLFLGPMAGLGVLVLVAGAATAPVAGPSARLFAALGPAPEAGVGLGAATVLLGIAGLLAGRRLAVGARCPMTAAVRKTEQALQAGFYVDAFYRRTVVAASVFVGRIVVAVDALVDGLYTGTAAAVAEAGRRLREAEAGQVQRYNAVALLVLVIIALVAVIRGL